MEVVKYFASTHHCDTKGNYSYQLVTGIVCYSACVHGFQFKLYKLACVTSTTYIKELGVLKIM